MRKKNVMSGVKHQNRLPSKLVESTALEILRF